MRIYKNFYPKKNESYAPCQIITSLLKKQLKFQLTKIPCRDYNDLVIKLNYGKYFRKGGKIMSNAKLRTSLGSISHNFIAERRCEITSVMR